MFLLPMTLQGIFVKGLALNKCQLRFKTTKMYCFSKVGGCLLYV